MKRSEASREQEHVPARQPDAKKATRELKIPYDDINEQVVIAAAAIDQATRAKLLAIIPADSFFGDGHADIWNALAELERKKLGFDLATLRQIAPTCDWRYVEELMRQRHELPENLSHHVSQLRWDRARVETARGPLSQFIEGIKSAKTEPERLMSLSRQIVASIGNHSAQRYLRDPSQLLRENREARKKRKSGINCWSYGLDGLDKFEEGATLNGEDVGGQFRMVPGPAPAQLSVVTGVPGSGKTTMMCAMATGQAKMKRKTLYGAWEQGSNESLELCAAISLGFDRKRVLLGETTEDEDRLLAAEEEELSEYLRFFDLPFSRSVKEKRSNDRNLDAIQQYIVESGCEVFIADLWRRCLSGGFDPDEEEQALYRQQAIATETRAHCFLVHQQRLKDLEARPDKRPTRESIKGSGAWIEVPDTILATHRPAQWKNIADDRMEVIILKQRRGVWPLCVEFDWNPATGTILNGKTIDYVRPGELSEGDELLQEAKEYKGGKGKKGKWKS